MLRRQRREVVSKSLTVVVNAIPLKIVTAVAIKLRGSTIQRECNVLPQRITRVGHGFTDHLKCCRVRW